MSSSSSSSSSTSITPTSNPLTTTTQPSTSSIITTTTPSSTTIPPTTTSSQPPTSSPSSNDSTITPRPTLTDPPPPVSQPSTTPPSSQPPTTDLDPDPTTVPSSTIILSNTLPSLSDSDSLVPTSLTESDTLPFSTFSSTIFLTATDGQGSITLSAPALITSLATSTRPDGTVTTITKVIANPTLIGNNASSRTSAFFKNTGAVAGVFVLVGLALVSIILWIIFAVRRRRRHQRLDHDTAVSATLAAAGFHRTPLVDDDEDNAAPSTLSRYSPALSNPFMGQRSSSGLALSNRASLAYLADNDNEFVVPGSAEYNPYAEYTPTRTDGYVPVPPPTASPIFPFPYRDRSSAHFDSQGTGIDFAHARTNSIEPLIAQPPQSATNLTSLPPAYGTEDLPLGIEIARAMDASGASSLYSQQSNPGPDARLDPGISQRLNPQDLVADDAASLFRDEEDYSRPVLGVRNMPDTASQAS